MIKEQIENLLRSTKIAGIEDLITYMGKNQFYEAPCSGRYHLSMPGGLAVHSLNVYVTMYKLNDSLNAGLDKNSMIITGLLHDIGKATYHAKDTYIPNILKDGKLSLSKPYIHNSALLGIPHEIASLEIISKYIDLTEDEAMSVVAHNGLYTQTGYFIRGKETKLYLLLSTADMYCSRFSEASVKQ